MRNENRRKKWREDEYSRLEFYLIRVVLDYHVEDQPAILRYNVATYTQDGSLGNVLLTGG